MNNNNTNIPDIERKCTSPSPVIKLDSITCVTVNDIYAHTCKTDLRHKPLFIDDLIHLVILSMHKDPDRYKLKTDFMTFYKHHVMFSNPDIEFQDTSYIRSMIAYLKDLSWKDSTPDVFADIHHPYYELAVKIREDLKKFIAENYIPIIIDENDNASKETYYQYAYNERKEDRTDGEFYILDKSDGSSRPNDIRDLNCESKVKTWSSDVSCTDSSTTGRTRPADSQEQILNSEGYEKSIAYVTFGRSTFCRPDHLCGEETCERCKERHSESPITSLSSPASVENTTIRDPLFASKNGNARMEGGLGGSRTLESQALAPSSRHSVDEAPSPLFRHPEEAQAESQDLSTNEGSKSKHCPISLCGSEILSLDPLQGSPQDDGYTNSNPANTINHKDLSKIRFKKYEDDHKRALEEYGHTGLVCRSVKSIPSIGAQGETLVEGAESSETLKIEVNMKDLIKQFKDACGYHDISLEIKEKYNKQRKFQTREFARLGANMKKHVAVSMPPRTYKSEIISIVWPAWILAQNPRRKIITVSESKGLAEHFATKTRHLIKEKWFRIIFPDVKTLKGTNTKSYYETTHHGGRKAVRAEENVLGYGADYIILDDPQSITKSRKTAYRNRLYDWFRSVLGTRMNNPGAKERAVLCMHRIFSKDDLVSYLQENAESTWEFIQDPLQYLKAKELVDKEKGSGSNTDKLRILTKKEIASFESKARKRAKHLLDIGYEYEVDEEIDEEIKKNKKNSENCTKNAKTLINIDVSAHFNNNQDFAKTPINTGVLRELNFNDSANCAKSPTQPSSQEEFRRNSDVGSQDQIGMQANSSDENQSLNLHPSEVNQIPRQNFFEILPGMTVSMHYDPYNSPQDDLLGELAPALQYDGYINNEQTESEKAAKKREKNRLKKERRRKRKEEERGGETEPARHPEDVQSADSRELSYQRVMQSEEGDLGGSRTLESQAPATSSLSSQRAALTSFSRHPEEVEDRGSGSQDQIGMQNNQQDASQSLILHPSKNNGILRRDSFGASPLNDWKKEFARNPQDDSFLNDDSSSFPKNENENKSTANSQALDNVINDLSNSTKYFDEAINPDNGLPLRKVGDKIIQREDDILDKKRFPEETIKEIEERTETSHYNAMYLQHVDKGSCSIVNPSSFKYFDYAEIISRVHSGIMPVIISWDTATSEGSNAYSVGTVWGVWDNCYYLIDMYRKQVGYVELKEAVIDLFIEYLVHVNKAGKFETVHVLIEDKSSGRQLIQELEGSENEGMLLVKMDPKRESKESRLKNVKYMFDNGRVYFPKLCFELVESYHDFAVNSKMAMDELSNFPNGKYDDIVDSTSWLLLHAHNWNYIYYGHRKKKGDTVVRTFRSDISHNTYQVYDDGFMEYYNHFLLLSMRDGADWDDNYAVSNVISCNDFPCIDDIKEMKNTRWYLQPDRVTFVPGYALMKATSRHTNTPSDTVKNPSCRGDLQGKSSLGISGPNSDASQCSDLDPSLVLRSRDSVQKGPPRDDGYISGAPVSANELVYYTDPENRDWIVENDGYIRGFFYHNDYAEKHGLPKMVPTRDLVMFCNEGNDGYDKKTCTKGIRIISAKKRMECSLRKISELEFDRLKL